MGMTYSKVRMIYGKRGRKLRIKRVNHMVTSCNVTSKMSPSIVTNCHVAW